MLGFYWDPTYIIMVPAIIFALYAQQKINSTFKKYQKIRNSRGYTAADVARQILDENGLFQVRIERIQGNLTDHYDPKSNVVRLSDTVYGSQSVASIGVAAHEVGHAIQHATGYTLIRLRTALVPVANIGSSLGIWIVFIGLFIVPQIAIFGIVLFSASTLFQLVTLPVELNASNRALKTLEGYGILYDEELVGAKKVLRAAALTYVASLVSSLLTLLRLVLRVGMISGRRDD